MAAQAWYSPSPERPELQEEVRLSRNAKEREKYDKQADLYAAINTLQCLEQAYVRDCVTPEEYTSNCSKLLTQIKLAFKLVQDDSDVQSDSFQNIESFMERFKLDAKSALERIKDGRPITILDDKGNRKAMNAIAEIVSLFITVMDKLRLKFYANDELQGEVRELLETMSRLSLLPNSYSGREKIATWLRKMEEMPASAELTEDEARQLLFDLEQSHNEFSRILKEHSGFFPTICEKECGCGGLECWRVSVNREFGGFSYFGRSVCYAIVIMPVSSEHFWLGWGTTLLRESEIEVSSFAVPFINEPIYYNLTEEILVRLELENVDLGLVGRDAVSAVQRASSKACKTEILRSSRKAVDENLHANFLPSFCPSHGRKIGRFLGCFQDGRNRFLNDTHVVLKTENTPKNCVSYCRLGGYVYAGVQYGTECWCGTHLSNNPVPLESSRCDMTCSGDPTSTCGGFYTIAVYETGTNGIPFSDDIFDSRNEESSTRVAFMLLFNGRNYRQAFRLLKNIYSPRHFYYLHIDERAELMFNALKVLNGTRNIFVVPEGRRRSSIWGGASLLTVVLEGFQVICEVFPEFDFVLNLSESDFPIRKLSDLEDYLSVNRGKNFLRSHGSQPHEFFNKQGLSYVFLECERRMWNIGKDRYIAGITYDGGSDWFVLSSPFVKYVASEGRVLGEEELFTGLRQFFAYKLLPVEVFLHTLLANSALCATRVNAHLRAINWQRRKSCGCKSKKIVDWCGCSPSIYRQRDFERISYFSAKNVFFGRKFDPTVDLMIINMVERDILENSLDASSDGEFVYSIRSPCLSILH
ncbi:unnamed protein product [Notodromas monacha]|uniref:Vacuolar protein sorting-associated protein 28 homolog n=1 Tax=Notodromas monacha TaxID=399045 RepID=A0A7R9BXK5_9CRUS|nr:unnamed protein product [Notodromas monacha]CAG0922483.1 unnamed protein product [Notodromas monacha]